MFCSAFLFASPSHPPPTFLALLNAGVSRYLLANLLLHLTRPSQSWPCSPCIKMEDGHGEKGMLKGRKRSRKESMNWYLLYSSFFFFFSDGIIRDKIRRTYRDFWTMNNQRLVKFCIKMFKFNPKSSSIPFPVLIYLILASQALTKDASKWCMHV